MLNHNHILLCTGLHNNLQKVLNCLARCFGCYSMSDPAAEALADDITAAEGVLAERRNTLKLGYTPLAGTSLTALLRKI
jgi:hypothetical protein